MVMQPARAPARISFVALLMVAFLSFAGFAAAEVVYALAAVGRAGPGSSALRLSKREEAQRSLHHPC